MAKTLQFRRGTTTELSTIAGAVGELFVDTTKDTVVVMDGSTAGGFPLAKESDVTALTTSINGKANTSDVNTALAGKANASDLAGKQATLVSGTNIKTVNGTSILGSGNINIAGGGGGDLTQVASDITPSFSEVYDIGSETQRFYDAYLTNKLDIDGTTLVGNSTLISAAIPAVVGGTTITPTTVNFDGFANGQAYWMGTSIVFGTNGATGTAVGFDTWMNNHYWKLAGASITVTSVPGTEPTTTTTISFATGSAPGFGFVVADSQGWWSHITSISITYNETVTIPSSPAVPAVWDRTVSTNASLIAPEVLVDAALLGDLHVEGSTITPAHVLGQYVDTKGTAIVDGSLHASDNISARNVIVQTSTVNLGKVTGKTSIPPSVSEITYSGSNFGGYGYGYFYSSYADVYASTTFTGNFKSIMTSIGNTIRIIHQSNPNYWWDLQVTGIGNNNDSYFQLQYNVITPSPAAQANGWNYPNYYDSYYSTSATIRVTYTIPTQYLLEVDNTPVTLSAGDKLLVNGNATSAPTSTPLHINSTLNIMGFAGMQSNDMMMGVSWTLQTSWTDLTTTTDANILSMLSMFKDGNVVTVNYNGASGSYLVSNGHYVNGMMMNTGWSFNLTFQSGVNFSGGDLYYAFGNMGTPFDLTTNVVQSINYSNLVTQFATSVAPNKYQSSSNYDWLSVGDTLTYKPVTATVAFKKDDNSLVKTISFNNATGELTYSGLVQVFNRSSGGDILTSDANANQLTDSSSSLLRQSIRIGFNAYATTAGGYDSSIAIGRLTNAQGDSIAIGGSANAGDQNTIAIGKSATGGYVGVAIGNQANSGSLGVAIGNGAQANGGIAIGNTAYTPSAGNISFGHGSRHVSNEYNMIVVNNSNTILTANTLYYYTTGSNSFTTDDTSVRINDMHMNNICGYGNYTTALLEIDTLVKAKGDTNVWQYWKAKYVASHTSSSSWTLTQVDAPTLAASGGGISSNGWTVAFALDPTYSTYFMPKLTSLVSRNCAVRTRIKVMNMSTFD